MSTARDASPIATGDLASTPFGHLALYLYRKASSGTLVVRHAEGRAEILFKSGHACAARFSPSAADLFAGLLPLCGLADGSFAFYGQDLLSDTGENGGEVDPYVLLAASMEDHARDDMVDAVLDHMSRSPLRIQPGRDLDRLRLGRRDSVLIDLIRAAPASITELCRQSPLGKERTRRLLYLLVVTHMVAPYADRGDNEIFRSHVRQPSGAPSQHLSGGPNASGNPQPLTGMTSSGGVPAWRSLASLRPSMPTAMAIGSDPSRLRVSLGPPGPTSQPPADDEKSALKRIDKYCERGDFGPALAVANELADLDNPSANAYAVRAYVLLKQHGQRPEGLPREVRDGLRKAIAIDPDNARALLTKGLVYKAAGELRKAKSCFRRACEADRHNLEARRELRLARMRDAG